MAVLKIDRVIGGNIMMVLIILALIALGVAALLRILGGVEWNWAAFLLIIVSAGLSFVATTTAPNLLIAAVPFVMTLALVIYIGKVLKGFFDFGAIDLATSQQ